MYCHLYSSKNNRYAYPTVWVYLQVQNMTQSIQVLDQRTQRDLQYVVRMEDQLRGLETKFRQVEENHKQNLAKQYKVRHGTRARMLGSTDINITSLIQILKNKKFQ